MELLVIFGSCQRRLARETITCGNSLWVTLLVGGAGHSPLSIHVAAFRMAAKATSLVDQDSQDKYTVPDAVATFTGAKTICANTRRTTCTFSRRSAVRLRRQFRDSPAGGRGRGPQGPIVGARSLS